MHFRDKLSVMTNIIIWTHFLSSFYETIHLGLILSSPSQESHLGISQRQVRELVIHTSFVLKTVLFMKNVMSLIDNFLFLLYECIPLVIDLSKGTIYLAIKLSAMCLCTFPPFLDLWYNHKQIVHCLSLHA